MQMTPPLRKFALIVHLTVSVGWIGAVMAYLALGIAAVRTDDPSTVRAAWISMEVVGWYAILPLAVSSFLTGLIMSLGTKWGLFRHYWTVFSLALTAFATLILVAHMPDVSALADVARTASDAELAGGLGGDLGHAGGGLFVLLVITVLNVYKPRGLTRHGWRKQQAERQPPPT